MDDSGSEETERVDPWVGPGDALEAGERRDELPIVARMVIEIRSDGTRTIARGAIDDRLNGEQVAVEAEAGSPLELSRALTKMVLSAPFAALLRGSKNRAIQAKRSSQAEPSSQAERPIQARLEALGRRLGQRIGQRLGPRDDD